MIRKLDVIFQKAVELEKKNKIAVAAAQDEAVLQSVEQARKMGVCEAILVGDTEQIRSIAENNNIDLSNYEIIEEKDIAEAAKIAVQLVSSGKAQILMKGLLDTSVILRAVLNKEYGLRVDDNVLSHISVIESEKSNKLYLVTDGGMNIKPDVEQKKRIIRNAVNLSRKLENPKPNVAILCAKEKIDPNMPCTMEAKQLCEEYDEEIYGECTVGGPFGFDNAISKESAKIKKVTHPGAGDADILLAPNIESGNILLKVFTFYCESRSASILMGAKAPIIVTSRADSKDSKLCAIALASIF